MLVEPLKYPGSILVVEDESVLLQFVCLVLSRAGFSVLSAANGDEAWSLFNAKRKSILLVLTDIVMPGACDGFELSSRLKRRAPEIPVLFMSGALPSDDALAQDLVNQHLLLRKPFTPDQLLAIVQEHLTGIEYPAHSDSQG
jgi:two-component system, cell cycle response regulator CpdR